MELLVVLAIFGIVAAIAIPAASPAVSGYRLTGAARGIAYNVSLAKMRAAAGFTRARLFANLSDGSYRIEGWDKTATAWVTEGGTTSLPQGSSFSYGAVAEAPPDTQGTLGWATPCLDNAGVVIANSSCVLFNSRGIPIDALGVPIGTDALYITDGTAVFGVTIAATGQTQLWWTPTRTLAWQKQ
jgi:hypothetical protein